MIALIPARAGSERIPGKNTRLFFGHPLISYTIQTALDSGLFSRIIVCSDDHAALECALAMGVQTHHQSQSAWARTINGYRPDDPDTPVPAMQPDIVWIREVIESLRDPADYRQRPATFCILRPTSPFRTVAFLQRAWQAFHGDSTADSVRAVERVTQHPGKMWTWVGAGYPIAPLMDQSHWYDRGRYLWADPQVAEAVRVPWHSSPTQQLPVYYVQNASLEMAWTRNVEVYGTIHGRKVAPVFGEGHEAFDINTPADWREAEYLVASGAVALPSVGVAPQGRPTETLVGTHSDRPVDL